MNQIERIINTALAEVGYKENPKNSNLTKYGKEYGMNGQPWCVIFAWWVFKHSDLSVLFHGGGKCASCTQYLNWARQNGKTTTTPAKGDLVIYQFANSRHFGIVKEVLASHIVSIEGNTGNESQNNGGEVMVRTRPKNQVLAYIHPDYCEAKKTKRMGSVWSRPIKQDKYRERFLNEGHEVTVLLPSFYKNGEEWYKTIKDKYVLSKIF